MPRRKFSDEQLLELYSRGLPLRQIARTLGVHESTVKRRRRELGLQPRPRCTKLASLESKFVELWQKGLTYRQISAALSVDVKTVWLWRKRLRLMSRRSKRTTDLKRVLYLFKVKRMGYEEIARELGVSPKTAMYLVGKALMERCRRDATCPYKPLLPEVMG